jgi:hypothetical protein
LRASSYCHFGVAFACGRRRRYRHHAYLYLLRLDRLVPWRRPSGVPPVVPSRTRTPPSTPLPVVDRVRVSRPLPVVDRVRVSTPLRVVERVRVSMLLLVRREPNSTPIRTPYAQGAKLRTRRAHVTRLIDLEDGHALARAKIACLVVREAPSVPDSYRDRLVLTPL